MRLLLLRHGRTEWNDNGRFQGQADPPLDAVGRAQAALVGPVIQAMRPQLVVSSDLLRCRATAATLGLPYRPDARLREIDLGAWSGLTSDEARRLFPEEDAAWRRGDDVRRGGGETYAEVGARAGALFDEVAAAGPPAGPDSLVVFVLHGGTARALIGRLLGLPPETWWHFGPLRNCHWSLLRAEHGRFRLAEHNVGVQRADKVTTGPRDAVAGTSLPTQLPGRPLLGGGDDSAAPDTDPVHSPTRSEPAR
ncbi:histidine phosphatase family protein [Frankia sp. CNm7]|uniref:Histidine phosphatase family protein n=1 Tax=Frankia nepalensis TaxID=1836974 RepID=A0A937UQA6_9ACTN|nr:histidine phosphatase family protein [Frankia nepalensis]MBL7496494.1 histidine phosphatase family protein [Frankia nepalensis]MBL7515556.1 histidine phosphatase family protein [Frankia nepalensis]MBL7519102.1 histidine phosphatase family protein [Frankia nepalensis]MBL7628065.1 histidine phosphatase family protein [Frankia nepalensis]